jgi:hypothetical protein
MLRTSLTGGVDRSDQSGLSCCSCPASSGVLHAFVQGELHWFRGSMHVCRVAAALFQVVFCMHSSSGSCIGSGGAYMCAGGALCGFSSFGLVVCSICSSFVLSRMCRAVALAKGVRDLSSSSVLALCLCLAFDRFLFVSFIFLYSCYFKWVLSMHSSRGRLRTKCGSRTGGWSLPGVMSD